MLLTAVQPYRLLFGVQRIVGHHHAAQTRDLEDSSNVLFDRLRSEKNSRFFQGRRVRGQVKRMEDGDDAARRFRNWAVFNEQRPPDGVGLFSLREPPILVGRRLRRPEKLRLEIMVS